MRWRPVTVAALCGITLSACSGDGGANMDTDQGGSMQPTTMGDGDQAPTTMGDGTAAPTSNDTTGGDVPVSSALPAACTGNDGCPDGIECVLPPGGGTGYCNVADTAVEGGAGEGAPVAALGQAAPCGTSADCPADVECVVEGDGPGFCDVPTTDVAVEEPGPVSSAAPAPCESAADCPAGIGCVGAESGLGFCDVAEALPQ